MNAKKEFNNAQLLFINGKFEECAASFTKALGKGYDNSMVFLSRGVAYLKMGKADEAIRDFTRTIASDRNNVRAYYYRGTAYLSNEDLGHAAVDFDKTIALNPDYGAAYFGRGTIYALMGEDEQASRYIKTAIIKSETEIQGFADVFGISRTQFEKAMAHLSGERKHAPTLMLTGEEIETVKEWMDAA